MYGERALRIIPRDMCVIALYIPRIYCIRFVLWIAVGNALGETNGRIKILLKHQGSNYYKETYDVFCMMKMKKLIC